MRRLVLLLVILLLLFAVSCDDNEQPRTYSGVVEYKETIPASESSYQQRELTIKLDGTNRRSIFYVDDDTYANALKGQHVTIHTMRPH